MPRTMSVPGPPSKQAKWVWHTSLFPLTYLPLANSCYAELPSHRRMKITNPVCGRWCGSGTSGTERLCWELFALPGLLAPASLHAPDLPPLPFPLSLSLSLASPYAQNLRLISSSAGQSPRILSVQYITPVLWACAHEKWQRASFRGLVTLTSRGAGRRWRAWRVTLSPLLVIAVEWLDRTASSAPRPSTVSECVEVWRGLTVLLL